MFRCETFIDDIISDCETLELLPENSVIIHPFIDTDDIIIDGQTLRFPLPNLNRKNAEVNSWKTDIQKDRGKTSS